ncbi:hypothetical protein [Endozoicomonas sp. G2_2]|nr:hypothetical protein [Endozoicomonas sp. G2_2]
MGQAIPYALAPPAWLKMSLIMVLATGIETTSGLAFGIAARIDALCSLHT